MKHPIAKASVCTILSLALVVAGCSTSWINTALADLPVITEVALNIASLVAGAQSANSNGASSANSVATEVQNIAAQVKSDLTLVQSLITSYQSATPAQKPVLVQKISAALADVQTNLNAILTAVHVKDAALQATITAAVGVAVTTIVSIESLLPQPAPAPTPGTVRASHAVKPASASQLKKQFNAIFVANGFPQAEVK